MTVPLSSPDHPSSPWNRTKLEPSSESDTDNADITSARDATPPPPAGQRAPHKAPPRATAVSSNDSEFATPENTDHLLLADELR